MIGGQVLDLAAVLLMHGHNPLTELGRPVADLAILDTIAAHSRKLWAEQLRLLLHEHAIEVGEYLGVLRRT